jgi:hypothetical protein
MNSLLSREEVEDSLNKVRRRHLWGSRTTYEGVHIANQLAFSAGNSSRSLAFRLRDWDISAWIHGAK